MKNNIQRSYADFELHAQHLIAEYESFAMVFVNFVDTDTLDNKLSQQLCGELEAVMLEFCKGRDLFVHYNDKQCCMLWHRFSSEASLLITIKKMRKKWALVFKDYLQQQPDLNVSITLAFQLHNEELALSFQQMKQQLHTQLQGEIQGNMLLSSNNLGRFNAEGGPHFSN